MAQNANPIDEAFRKLRAIVNGCLRKTGQILDPQTDQLLPEIQEVVKELQKVTGLNREGLQKILRRLVKEWRKSHQ